MWDDYYGNTHYQEKPFTDTAQICMNGHIINESINRTSELSKKHCPECGEPTITACPECKHHIPGHIFYPNIIGGGGIPLPAFCEECGKPYPWTVTNMKAAKELAAEVEGITKEDVAVLEKSIDEVVKDTPQAQVGATRIKRILTGARSATGEILYKLIVDVSSETAKKILTGK